MPLASPPGRPDVVYGFGRIDASGRVADRVTIAALGWRGGDRLTVTADAGVMIARRDPGGMVTVPARPYVVIPAALRRRCGLRAGDHVLLAASPGQDTLAAYSFAVVDQALRAHAPACRRREAAMTAVHPEASRQAVVEAALVLLERMGLTPADLAAVPQHRKPVPTFAEYVPVVSAAVSAGTRRAYGSYWNRVIDQWGDRRLDEPTPSEIRQLMAYVKTHVVARRNARGGRSAEEHLVAALRCLYQRAVDDGLIAEADNPARKVAKPRRLPTTRRALPDNRLAEINEVAAATGDDPELDTLILAAAHRDRLPARRRAGPAPAGPGPGPVPGPAAGEGRDGPLAAGLPHLDGPPGRARPGAACPGGRAAAAVRRRAADHPPPV